MTWVRGVLFQTLAYGAMVLMGLVGAPVVLWSREWTYGYCRLYCRIVFWLARTICGLRVEIRGPVPTGEVVIAAKHQSMLDVFMIFAALPRAKFVMKRELQWVPVFGQYAMRIGSTPVNRGEKGAGEKMLSAVEQSRAERGQLVIYPQGTRVAPGVRMPFKRGAIRAYQRFGLPMVLAATNAGVFWPRRGWAIRPGTAVVEFGETLPPGLSAEEVSRRMAEGIERESDRLVEEAKTAMVRRPGAAPGG